MNALITEQVHYDGDDCWVAIEDTGLGPGFNFGNMVKYIWRHEKKAKPVEDLRKALSYARRMTDQGAVPTLLGSAELREKLKCVLRTSTRASVELREQVSAAVDLVFELAASQQVLELKASQVLELVHNRVRRSEAVRTALSGIFRRTSK